MEWIADPAAGDWLRERLDSGYDNMHGVVPRGYPAYARVFHPALVRTLPGGAVPTYDEYERLSSTSQQEVTEAFADSPASWADTASAFHTTMHPLAQWQRIVRTPPEGDWYTQISPDGREFNAPELGSMAPEVLAPLGDHLVAHTSTPDSGIAALWSGWGDLVGFFTTTPSSRFFVVGGDANHQAMLDRSTHDPFNNVFRKPTWQDGILSREISEGPRLKLPGRDYVLFTAAPHVFTDPAWILDAPWRDLSAEAHGFPAQAQHPNILWPEDHAWVMVSEIDFDSTVVGGSRELIAAICADPRLEAMPIPEGASLQWDADTVNATDEVEGTNEVNR